MARMRITYQGPDLKGRGIKKTIAAGVDRALLNHRKKFLPLHFEEAALTRYPEEFRAAIPKQRGGSESRAAASRRIRKELSQMDPRKRSEWYRRRKQRLNEDIASWKTDKRKVIDRRNKIPLVYTGRLRTAVLKGAAALEAPVARRRLTITNAPPYVYYKTTNDLGVFDIVRAIQALHPTEITEFGRVADAEIDRRLSK